MSSRNHFNSLPALLVGEERKAPLREATVHHSGQGKFAIHRGDGVLILAPTGDGAGKRGEPDWFREERGYTPHSEAGELYNLGRDPTQKDHRYAAEQAWQSASHSQSSWPPPALQPQ